MASESGKASEKNTVVTQEQLAAAQSMLNGLRDKKGSGSNKQWDIDAARFAKWFTHVPQVEVTVKVDGKVARTVKLEPKVTANGKLCYWPRGAANIPAALTVAESGDAVDLVSGIRYMFPSSVSAEALDAIAAIAAAQQ